MVFDTDFSGIRPSGFFHYLVSSNLKFSSAGLANLDLKFESEQVSISGASLVITGPYYWRSLLMALHTPLVFVGLIGIGPSSWYFSYRCPWTYRASLLRSVLISLSGGDTDNPRTSRQNLFRGTSANRCACRRLLQLARSFSVTAERLDAAQLNHSLAKLFGALVAPRKVL